MQGKVNMWLVKTWLINHDISSLSPYGFEELCCVKSSRLTALRWVLRTDGESTPGEDSSIVIFLRKYMKQIQLDFTSITWRIRDGCVRRPWPMGAPSQKNNVVSLFPIKQNSKLFTAGHWVSIPPHLYSRRHGDRCDITVMNASVGILKSVSCGNQGQMVIFYERCRIIKPNDCDYFGRQIFQTWRRSCKCKNEDYTPQTPRRRTFSFSPPK